MKSILLIAFHYPPVKGSSGLHRTLSMSRYLQDFEWQPIILSVSDKAYEQTSDELLNEVPKDLLVMRTLAFDSCRHFSIKGRYPLFLALPDRWSSWWFGGIWRGLRLVKKLKPKIIWSTYPIATAHLIGLTLHKLTGVPWVADFRDSMTEDDYPRHPLVRKVYRWIERKTIQNASRVVFTTSGALEMYAERYPHIAREKWAVVENAVDEDFISKVEQSVEVSVSPKSTKLKLLHSGVLYPNERDPTHFFAAVHELKEKGCLSANEVEFVFRASTNEESYRKQTRELGIDDLVHFEPAVAYHEAIKEMLEADGLMIFQAKGCNHQIPAKIYEYFRSGRPILGLTGLLGNTADLLKTEEGTMTACLDDPISIVEAMPRYIDFCNSNRYQPVRTKSDKYSRASRVKEYAKIFNQVN